MNLMNQEALVITSCNFPLIPGTRFITPDDEIPDCYEVILIIGPDRNLESGWTEIMQGDAVQSLTDQELRRQIATGIIQLIPTTYNINHIPQCG